MKLKSTTLILVLAALLLGGFVYFFEVRSASQQEVEERAQKLFSFEEDKVESLSLKTQLRTLTFERSDEGNWQMTTPEQVPAEDAAVAYLLNLLATGRSDRTLTIPTEQREEFGLHQPLATIEVTLDNQETHKLIVGGYDFSRNFLYAQVDPPTETVENLEVSLISPDFDNAVNRPFGEWKRQANSDAVDETTQQP